MQYDFCVNGIVSVAAMRRDLKELLGLADKKLRPNVWTARRLTTFHCNSVFKRLGIRCAICYVVRETL